LRWEHAVRKWAPPQTSSCLATGRRVVAVSGAKLFAAADEAHITRSLLYTQLHSAVTRDILALTPEAFAVAKMARARLPAVYLGAHLRNFDSSSSTPDFCLERMRKEGGFHYLMQCQIDPEATPEEVCTVAASYVHRCTNAAQYSTIYIARDQDRHSTQRLAEIEREQRYQVVTFERALGNASYAHRRYALAVDMYLLMEADFFMGIPASTLSLNVARARAANAPATTRGLATEGQTNLVLPCGMGSHYWSKLPEARAPFVSRPTQPGHIG